MLTFEDLLQQAERDSRILGVVLSGSRGRGGGRADSDWDAYLIVADDAAGALNRELGGSIDALLDLSILTLREFESYAAPGSEHAWEAYAFVHATIAHDRLDGRIGKIAAAKEALSPELADSTARQALDAFINASVRAAKDRRDGQDIAASLDEAESVGPALETLFALERRIRPYNRYLTWELERHPLAAIDSSRLPRLVAAVPGGGSEASASLFACVERSARATGLDDVLNSWDESDLKLPGIEVVAGL